MQDKNHQPESTTAIPNSALEKLLLQSNQELIRQRRGQYIGMAFKGMLFILAIAVAANAGKNGFGKSDKGDQFSPHIGSVEIYGPIMAGQPASADNIVPALTKAFENKLIKAVAIRINSPGGSPVQAGIIYNEIVDLKKKHPEVPVYAVIEDIGASAAYYIASAADKIYADKASMVGSIGVISSGFGYTELMSKLGVERRLVTSGTNKALLDPYLPVNEHVQTYWKSMLDEIHQQFIGAVIAGRGDRLKKDTPELFTGLVWTGEASKNIGLTDEIGNILTVSRQTVGSVNVVNYTIAPDLLSQLSHRASTEVKSAFISLNAPSLQ